MQISGGRECWAEGTAGATTLRWGVPVGLGQGVKRRADDDVRGREGHFK